MMKRIKLGLLLIVFCLPAIFSTVNAQTEGWLAWMYDASTGQMTQVDNNGFLLKTVILPTVFGYDYAPHVAVAPLGNRVAYLLENEREGLRTVAVYDVESRASLMSFSPPAPVGDISITHLNFIGRPEQFSSNGDLFAFGWSANNVWTLQIHGLTVGGSITHQMSATDSIAQSAGISPFDVPIPLWLDDENNQLHFVMYPTVSDSLVTAPSFIWDYVADTVQLTNILPTIDADIDPRTGETLFAYVDDRFPLFEGEGIAGMVAHVNTLHVHDARISEGTFPFLVSDFSILRSPRFIQDGERVLYVSSEIDGDAQNVHLITERDGTLAGLTPYERIVLDVVRGVPDGFIFSADSTQIEAYFPEVVGRNSTSLVYVQTQSMIEGNIGKVVWTGSPDRRSRLVWVRALGATDTLDAGRWAQVASPILPDDLSAPDVVATEDASPSTGGLIVGGSALVNTTEGDRANVRSGPGIGFSIVDRLANGTTVTILEGPANNDGFTWWRIRTPGGLEGWMVEEADDVRVLIGTSTDVTPIGTPRPGLSDSLVVGGLARVTVAGNNLNVRRDASTRAEAFAQLNTGDILNVLEGPRNANNFIWWRVNRGGISGWVAAGSADALWLEVYTGPSPTSTPAFIGLPAPTLIEPANGAVFPPAIPRQVNYLWSPVPGAVQYRLELDECIGGVCSNWELQTVANTAFLFAVPRDGAYRWRVRAIDADGEFGAPSEWRSFTYGAVLGSPPVLLLPPSRTMPSDGQTFDIFPRETIFRWFLADGAMSYQLQVQFCQGTLSAVTNCAGDTLINIPAPTTPGAFDVSHLINFVGAQPGRWRVRSVGNGGLTSDWTSWWYFLHNR